MYTFEINPQKKYLLAKVEGMMTVKDAENYTKELSEKISSINPSQYAFIMDGTQQKAILPEVVPYLKKAIELYITTPFKKRIYLELASAVASNQVKRVGENPLADHFSVASSLEEAIKMY